MAEKKNETATVPAAPQAIRTFAMKSLLEKKSLTAVGVVISNIVERAPGHEGEARVMIRTKTGAVLTVNGPSALHADPESMLPKGAEVRFTAITLWTNAPTRLDTGVRTFRRLGNDDGIVHYRLTAESTIEVLADPTNNRQAPAQAEDASALPW